MIFFVYTQENEVSIGSNLGLVDYSYFFVMKKFLPIIRQFGRIILVREIAEVDALLTSRLVPEEESMLLCFAPPHRAPVKLRCPVIMIFAWEYSTIPNEPWGNDPRQNWVGVLSEMRGAITHSTFAVNAVKESLGISYPVVSLPAPVWDDYADLCQAGTRAAIDKPWELVIENGVLLDSRLHNSENTHAAPTPSFIPQKHQLTLQGIIYTAIFNPNDGRKNWIDLISAFCFAFRENSDATLVLKLVYSDANFACSVVWHEMKKLSPYRCRIIAIQGYLDAASYRAVIANSTYIVNSAYGEGQCLPLMEFMSAGKPAIAPDHTAMMDYISPQNAFVVRSSEEWTHWPHDPRLVLRAFRYRINWQSLRDAFSDSYKVASEQPQKYWQMSQCATSSLHDHCSQAVIGERFSEFLQTLGYQQKRRSRSSSIREIIVRWLDKLNCFARNRNNA